MAKTRRRERVTLAAGRPAGPPRRKINGPNMRAARARLALSMNDIRLLLAKLEQPLVVDTDTLYTWEDGRGRPPAAYLAAIAKLLKLTLDDIAEPAAKKP